MVVFALYFGSFDEEKGLEIKGIFFILSFTSQISQLSSLAFHTVQSKTCN